jgi:tyrosine-protein kinase Etk/Wzc
VQIQAMRSYETSGNPELKVADDELAGVAGATGVVRAWRERRFDPELTGSGKVPSAGLEFVRNLREVKYRESLLEALTKTIRDKAVCLEERSSASW